MEKQGRLSLNKDALRRVALILVCIGEVWNFLEAGVAFWSAFQAGSIALLAYGLDSLIEIFAGLVLIWRLRKEWKQEEEVKAEQKALKLIGISFFVLAAYILIHSLFILFGVLPRPQESLIGVILVIASAVIMTVLYFSKVNIAKKIGSRALRAEAIESLICDLQDLTLLFGLLLNMLLGWWWADPLVALILIPFLLKEGWESFSPEKEDREA